MVLRGLEISSSGSAVPGVPPAIPFVEILSALGHWWASYLDASATALVTAGSVAADASKARTPLELLTKMPEFNIAAANAFQSYVRRTRQITQEIEMELAVIVAPLSHEIYFVPG